jgi:hypothetical protein
MPGPLRAALATGDMHAVRLEHGRPDLLGRVTGLPSIPAPTEDSTCGTPRRALKPPNGLAAFRAAVTRANQTRGLTSRGRYLRLA